MMQRLARLLRLPFFRRPPSPAREFSPGPLLDSVDKLEEEKLAWFSQDNFFPVKIGDVFHSKYQVVGKLGYGGYSTVLLCRDLQEHIYVTLKTYERDSAHAERESQVYDHLESLRSSHTGTILVRTVLDKFQLSSADGSSFHQCLIHPPLGMSLYELRNRTAKKVFPEILLKPTLIHILIALDFLHSEAHTYKKRTSCLMLKMNQFSSILSRRNFPIQSGRGSGNLLFSESENPEEAWSPVLSDFGEARFGSDSGTYCGDVQPFIYRAPEVLLRMPWDEKIDIWNLAVVAWDLFEQGHLFYARDANKQSSESHHLAEMIAYLGPPPREMIEKSEHAKNFFDNSGKWKGLTEVPSTSLEDLESNLQGEQQENFLRFMRKMLRWRPEERASAKELLSDPWLRSP
ncbi:kinase-like domain-containing protein [Penicillium maclennaniae]|uniref:kinase-like domain-containing protein n=1 Tax=Penicillium maclennaniae TaxID=1343394 RepID=UPI002541FD3B|nr:kinase-like domain-containing protein [Penicillium maclennaniae]KAJ5677298.1 kinase-like domain-containing protein [Penicillium maclennaniae]